MTDKVKDLILRRRRQMLIHSYLYYQLNDNIIDDHTWQAWADELAELQREYGWEWDFYDEAFEDWTGASGSHLPKEDWMYAIADQLRRYHDKPYSRGF